MHNEFEHSDALMVETLMDVAEHIQIMADACSRNGHECAANALSLLFFQTMAAVAKFPKIPKSN